MPQLTEAATVLTVSDVSRVAQHYRQALGFSIAFEYGDPPSYAGLCRDDVLVHVASAAITKRAPGSGDIALFVTGVDALHAELVARDANVLMAPEDRDYGMRDFSVLDPDGNRLTFGEATAA